MSRPKAYDPQQGYMYQLLTLYGRSYEHLDYAVDRADKNHLVKEYRMTGISCKVILLPKKYWTTPNN